MSAKILVVDDMPINLRLMQARLSAEYFEVVLATNGPEAIAICERETIDLVLLDVMMPEMDGYEVCRILKARPGTRHIPVVLVTALDQPSDRVAGLQSGADDFLIKPVRDLPLLSRIRSLTRLKMLTDELRVRAATARTLLIDDELTGSDLSGLSGRVMVVHGGSQNADRITRSLQTEHHVSLVGEASAALPSVVEEQPDLVVIDFAIDGYDPLRLCSQIRSSEATRQIPILVVAEGDDEVRLARALELGANDFIGLPIDRNELLARTRTQVKRRRYDERLRRDVREMLELATADPLTGVFNRRFLDTHLPRTVEMARAQGRPLSLLLADIDHFKRINDTWGHDAGDAVLREFAARLRKSLRASDLCCRIGGEEFAILMPDTDGRLASLVAERIRAETSGSSFDLGSTSVGITVSVGCAVLVDGTTPAGLLKAADLALYEAKKGGRNQVVMKAA